MKSLIAHCGLDCEQCDARRATLTDNQELKEKTAKLWSQLNGVPITADMINCEGCRMDGIKTPFCEKLCPIRQCALKKNITLCAQCPEKEQCETIKMISTETLEATFEHKTEMTFIGFHTSIRPEEAKQKCPEFWEREYTQKYAKLWQTMKPENAIEAAILENQIGLFAICNETETNNEYWIAGRYTGGEVPDGLSLFTFPESDWAIFEAKGPLPDSLQTLNRKVYFDWFPKEGKKRGANMKSFLEVHSPCPPQSPDYTCGLWIPVEK